MRENPESFWTQLFKIPGLTVLRSLWDRIVNNRINVIDYGAVEGNGSDCTGAFAAAVAAAGEHKMVYIPYGTYRGAITTGANTHIKSDNALIEAVVAGPILSIVNSGAMIHGRLRLDGRSIAGVTGMVMGGFGATTEQCEFQHITIDHCPTGLSLFGTPNDATGGCYMNKFGKLYIRRSSERAIWLKSGAISRVNANSWDFCSIQNMISGKGIEFDGADGNHWGFLEGEVNSGPLLYTIRCRGVYIDGGWWEDNSKSWQEAPGSQGNVSGIYTSNSHDGDFSDADPRVDFDHNVGEDRSLIFRLPYWEVCYGLRRQAGYLRIGKNGGATPNQSVIYLQVAGGQYCNQFSVGIPRYRFDSVDSGFGGYVFQKEGTDILDISLTQLTSQVPIVAGSFGATLLGDINGRDLSVRGVLTTGRILAAMLDNLVTVFGSGILFDFDFDARNRYNITALTADSTFTFSNVPADNPSTVTREIRVYVVAGNGFKLTTDLGGIVWDTQQGFNLGANEILILRTINGMVRGSWMSRPRITMPVFANNAAALGGLLSVGDLYRTNADPDIVCVVH